MDCYSNPVIFYCFGILLIITFGLHPIFNSTFLQIGLKIHYYITEFKAQTPNDLYRSSGQYSICNISLSLNFNQNPFTNQGTAKTQCNIFVLLTLDRLQSGKVGAVLHLANCEMLYSSLDIVESFKKKKKEKRSNILEKG